MHIQMAVPEEHVTPEVLDALLEAGTRLNTQLIKSGQVPTFDAALKAGKVKWKPEPPGAERFDHAGIVMGRGWGDCDDLGPWKAASLRATGADPGAQSVVYKSGPKRWHAVVSTSEGELVDPSLEAGMRKREGILPAVTGHMFDPHASAVVGDDGAISMRPALAMKQHPAGGWVGRADLPWSDTDYALTALHYAPVAAQAITGAILGACLVGQAADIARPEHVARLQAICGVIGGEQRDRLCALCGADAVEGAEEFLAVVGAQLAKPKLSAEHARRLAGQTRLDPMSLIQAAQQLVAHPASSKDESKIAELVAKYASGVRPRPGGLIDAVFRWQHTVFGPVVPGTAAEHARLLVADQVAKHLLANVPELAAANVVGFDLGGFIGDIAGNAGSIGKTIAKAVNIVAPVVSTASNALHGNMGGAISSAASLIGMVAGKAAGPAPPAPRAAAAAYAPAPAASPMAARPMAYQAAAPQGYAGSQPGSPPPPVHVHMAAAPRGAAASAPVHVSAQPGGPVTIRF